MARNGGRCALILIDNRPDAKGVHRMLSDIDGIDGMAELHRFLVKQRVKVLRTNKQGDAVALRDREARKVSATWTDRVRIDEIIRRRKANR